MSEPFQIWITKWAIFKGIEEATAWEMPGAPSRCVVASGPHKNDTLQAGQWHRTLAGAIKEAEAELEAKKQYHRERLEELESVCFTEDDNERTGNGTGEGAGDDEAGAQGQHEPTF